MPIAISSESLFSTLANSSVFYEGRPTRYSTHGASRHLQSRLRLMKDHITSSCSINRKAFYFAELAGMGCLQKAWELFGKKLDGLMIEMNVA